MPNPESPDQLNTLSFQQRLLDVVKALAAVDDYLPDDALVKLLETAREGLGADLARLVLLDDAHTALTAGRTPKKVSDLDRRVEKAVTGIPARVTTVMPGGKPFGTILAAAVRVGERLIGALWLGFGGAVDISEEGRLYLQLLTDHAALALAHLDFGVGDALAKPISDASIVEGFPLPFLLLDDRFVIRYLNRHAQRALGLMGDDAEGTPLGDHIRDDEFVSFVAGEKDTQELARSYVAIEERVYQIVLSRLKLDSLPGWRLVVMVDVSHFKRLNENMTLFLQTVSHDLRSPLTAAKGFVDMLPMVGEVNERQVMMLDKVSTSIVDMTNLVEKVLDAGRLDPEMGAYEIRREMCDPAEIVEKVASSMAPAAGKKSLSLEAVADNGIPVMNLDSMMIERSLNNLVENAIKYTPEGGSVWVRVQMDKKHLIFAVEDNGFGIPPDQLPRLFERGSRVRREEHKAIRGSGLGLFIVKNVAQQHGGDAIVESVEGQGSVFQIVIPLSGANMVAGT